MISELLKEINKQVTIEELESFDFDEFINNKIAPLNKEDTIRILNENGFYIKNIKKLDLTITKKFIYVYNNIPIEIYGVNNHYMKMIKKSIKYIEDFLNNKCKYDSRSFNIANNLRLDFFLKNYKKVSKIEAEKWFSDTYTMIEYGFNKIDKEILNYLYSDNIKDSNDSEYIDIYRGEGKLSNNLENSYSWTTNINIALKFMLRYGTNDIKLYKGKIKKGKVLKEFNNRNESEVIVNFEDIENVKKIDSILIENFKDNDCILYEYQTYVCKLNYLKCYIDDIEGIHGELHIKRTMLLSLLISYNENYSENYSNILITIALLHDIGRINNDVDKKHGRRAVELLEENEDIEDIAEIYSMNDDDINIVKFIIEYHSVNDEIAFKKIEENTIIEDKNKLIDLYKIFKDIDALDRVRLFNEFDIKYLRNDFEKYLSLAYELYLNIK